MKLILPYLIVAALSLPCCGQKGKKVTAEKVAVADTTYPLPEKPIGWTSDFEKVFTAEQISYLDDLIQRHKDQTSNEVAIVTLQLDSTNVKPTTDFDQLSLALVNKWGIGEKEKNNGVGIVICVRFRKISIQVGKGLTAKLTDEESKNIIDSIIIPEFKKGDYFRGVLNGLNAVFEEIK